MNFEPVYFVRQGNTADSLLYTPKDANGVTVNLGSHGAITFHMWKLATPPPRKVEDAVHADLVNPGEANQLRYDWQPEDVDEPGIYAFYFEVDMPDGKPRSFPNDHNDLLQVTPA